jgi:hypothetical protein
VAISLQPYVQGQKHDLFDGFSDEELLKLFEENPFLREQFIFFAEQTIHQWNGGKECYDLLGHENIVVVEDGGEFRLRIIDVGCFRLDMLGASRVEKMTRLEQRIGRMLSLLQRTKKIPDGLKIQYLLRMHTDK